MIGLTVALGVIWLVGVVGFWALDRGPTPGAAIWTGGFGSMFMLALLLTLGLLPVTP